MALQPLDVVQLACRPGVSAGPSSLQQELQRAPAAGQGLISGLPASAVSDPSTPGIILLSWEVGESAVTEAEILKGALGDSDGFAIGGA